VVKVKIVDIADVFVGRNTVEEVSVITDSVSGVLVVVVKVLVITNIDKGVIVVTNSVGDVLAAVAMDKREASSLT
jgi:hypothetical protein